MPSAKLRMTALLLDHLRLSLLLLLLPIQLLLPLQLLILIISTILLKLKVTAEVRRGLLERALTSMFLTKKVCWVVLILVYDHPRTTNWWWWWWRRDIMAQSDFQKWLWAVIVVAMVVHVVNNGNMIPCNRLLLDRRGSNGWYTVEIGLWAIRLLLNDLWCSLLQH